VLLAGVYKLSSTEVGGKSRRAIWYREHVIGNLSLVPKSSVFVTLWSPQVFQLRETEEVLVDRIIGSYDTAQKRPEDI
jgi:hypothetical protein